MAEQPTTHGELVLRLAELEAECLALREALAKAWPVIHYYCCRPHEQRVNASPSPTCRYEALDAARAALTGDAGRAMAAKIDRLKRVDAAARAYVEADRARGVLPGAPRRVERIVAWVEAKKALAAAVDATGEG